MELKHIKNLSLIDNYLLGNLSEEQNQEFLLRLNSDEELRKEYAFVKNLPTALLENRSRRLRNKFSTWDIENSVNGSNDSRQLLFPWKKYMAIAACISLLIFVATMVEFNSEIDTASIFADNFSPYPSETVRGEESDKGYIFYSNRDYNKAISAFQKSKDESAKFFIGNSFLALNEPNRAISALNSYKGKKYKLAAQWYLALAHLQNNDSSAAKAILENLTLQKGAYGKKAFSLLQTI